MARRTSATGRLQFLGPSSDFLKRRQDFLNKNKSRGQNNLYGGLVTQDPRVQPDATGGGGNQWNSPHSVLQGGESFNAQTNPYEYTQTPFVLSGEGSVSEDIAPWKRDNLWSQFEQLQNAAAKGSGVLNNEQFTQYTKLSEYFNKRYGWQPSGHGAVTQPTGPVSNKAIHGTNKSDVDLVGLKDTSITPAQGEYDPNAIAKIVGKSPMDFYNSLTDEGMPSLSGTEYTEAIKAWAEQLGVPPEYLERYLSGPRKAHQNKYANPQGELAPDAKTIGEDPAFADQQTQPTSETSLYGSDTTTTGSGQPQPPMGEYAPDSATGDTAPDTGSGTPAEDAKTLLEDAAENKVDFYQKKDINDYDPYVAEFSDAEMAEMKDQRSVLHEHIFGMADWDTIINDLKVDLAEDPDNASLQNQLKYAERYKAKFQTDTAAAQKWAKDQQQIITDTFDTAMEDIAEQTLRRTGRVGGSYDIMNRYDLQRRRRMDEATLRQNLEGQRAGLESQELAKLGGMLDYIDKAIKTDVGMQNAWKSFENSIVDWNTNIENQNLATALEQTLRADQWNKQLETYNMELADKWDFAHYTNMWNDYMTKGGYTQDEKMQQMQNDFREYMFNAEKKYQDKVRDAANKRSIASTLTSIAIPGAMALMGGFGVGGTKMATALLGAGLGGLAGTSFNPMSPSLYGPQPKPTGDKNTSPVAKFGSAPSTSNFGIDKPQSSLYNSGNAGRDIYGSSRPNNGASSMFTYQYPSFLNK